MKNKKNHKSQKDPDKLKKMVKKGKTKDTVSKNGFFEDDEILEMDKDDGFKNHGFEDFEEDDEDF